MRTRVSPARFAAAAAKAKTSKARKPAMLPKSDGDAGVQAYIASMEPWQAAVARRVDALVAKHVPGVRKAVRWHCPFYGVEGQGWFLAFAAFQRHIKFSFFKAHSANRPVQGRALPGCARVGRARREADGGLDRAGGLHPRLGRRIDALRRIPARGRFIVFGRQAGRRRRDTPDSGTEAVSRRRAKWS